MDGRAGTEVRSGGLIARTEDEPLGERIARLERTLLDAAPLTDAQWEKRVAACQEAVAKALALPSDAADRSSREPSSKPAIAPPRTGSPPEAAPVNPPSESLPPPPTAASPPPRPDAQLPPPPDDPPPTPPSPAAPTASARADDGTPPEPHAQPAARAAPTTTRPGIFVASADDDADDDDVDPLFRRSCPASTPPQRGGPSR